MSNNTKTLLLTLKDDCAPYEAPNFAYLQIDDRLSGLLSKWDALIKENEFDSVTKYRFISPTFLCDQDDGEEIEKSTVNASSLTFNGDVIWLDVRHEDSSGSSELTSTPISYKDVLAAPSDNDIEKLKSTFVSRWDDGVIETDCFINPRSGEIEIGVSSQEMDGGLEEELVIDDDGAEYRLFKDEDNDRYFIAPLDLARLLEARAAESNSPRH